MSEFNLRKKKTNHKKGIAAAKKAQKRIEAEERQAKFNSMNDVEKISRGYGYRQSQRMNRLKEQA